MDGQREATLLCSGGGETEASGGGVSDSSRAPTFSYVQKLCFTSLAVFMYKESSSTQASESALRDCRHTVIILMVYCRYTGGVLMMYCWYTDGILLAYCRHTDELLLKTFMFLFSVTAI